MKSHRIARRAVLLATTGFAITAAVFGPARPALADEVTVFAAASLRNALTDIAEQWLAETGNTAVMSFAGSSALARQIQEGAPADLFISANVDWMDTLEADGLIQPDTRRDILGNTLVLIAHGQDAEPVEIAPGFDLVGLLGDEHLAMAFVDSVPAGIYGREALTSLGIWEDVLPHVAQSENVRAALALVASGEAPYGITYATDAVADDNVTVVGTFPADSHPPIIYPAALTTEASGDAAAAFLDYLSTDAARPLFERQGFTVLD